MRKSVAGFLVSGVIFCAARFADLALFTDLETGLLIEGQVWLRYAVLFAWAALALAVGHTSAGSAAPLTAPKTRSAAFALSVPALTAGVFYLGRGLLDILAGSFLYGALGVLCALWLECLGQHWLLAGLGSRRRIQLPAWLGVLGSLLFVWDVLASFMTNGSSWHRTIPTSAVWQQLAALLLLAAVLRAVCLPGAASPKSVCRCGLLAYILCFAWQLPRCILLPAGPGDWALVALGLLGGACAMLCASPKQRGSHAAG